jgi:hypothetical protein
MTISPMTIRFATLVLTLLLVAGACSETSDTPTTTTGSTAAAGPVELPANPDPPKSATIYATLQGDATLDGGCVWLRQTNIDFSVLWPTGFTADFDPIRLYNEAGNLVAEEGDQVVATGAFAVDASEYQPHRCTVGAELWLAGSVEKND